MRCEAIAVASRRLVMLAAGREARARICVYCFSFISDIMNVIFRTKREREKEKETNNVLLICVPKTAHIENEKKTNKREREK